MALPTSKGLYAAVFSVLLITDYRLEEDEV